MSFDFSKIAELSTARGKLVELKNSAGNVIWAVKSESGGAIILEVEKITSDTYAAETTYKGEQFILLDIYPKTNGTVKVTYGGLTKTITDTSGAAEPNAQQVFFGTFNGVTDEVETPASGTLTIEGDFYAFGGGAYSTTSKSSSSRTAGNCITEANNLGEITLIPDRAFYGDLSNQCKLSTIKIPNTVLSIGNEAFYGAPCSSIVIPESVNFIGYQAFGYFNADVSSASSRTVKVLATIPPEIGVFENSTETPKPQMAFDAAGDYCTIKIIIVPQGCGNAYKAAAGWSQYTDYIVEAS